MAGEAGSLGRAFVEIHVPVEAFASQMSSVGTTFTSQTSRMIAEAQLVSAAIGSANAGIISSYNAVATSVMGLLTAQELAILSTNNLALALHHGDVAARSMAAGGVVLGTGMAAGAAGIKATTFSLASLMSMAKSVLPFMAAFMAVSKTIGIASGAVTAQREYNKELYQLWTLTDLTVEGIGELSDEIRDLTHDYNVFAKAGAKAMYQIYSATFFADDATEILEQGMKAAAAGATDLVSAVDMTTTVLNAYGMAASEASRINDLLFTTVRYGKTTYEELAGQFGRLAGVAAPAGARIEEMTAAIATLTRQGIMTDWAVTSLRQTIMSMFRPTGALAGVIRALGYETGRALITENGFVEALKMIKQEADAAGMPLENLFTNVRAITAVLPLLTTASVGFALDVDRMADSLGAMDTAFEKMEQDWDYRLETLKSQLNDVSLTIGEMLMPAVEAFMTVWVGFSEVMEKGIEVLGPFGQGMGALAGWVSGAAVSVGALTAAIWLLNKAFIALAANPVVAALGTVALAISVIVSQIMDANSAVHTLADEIRGLPTPGTVEAGRIGMPTASADIVAKFTPEINSFLEKWTEIMDRYSGPGAAVQVESWLPNLIRELEFEAMPTYTGGFSRQSPFALTIDNAPVREAIIATLISGVEDPSVARAIADSFGMSAKLGLSGSDFSMDSSGLSSSVFYDAKVAIAAARTEFDALWSSIQNGTVVVEEGETQIDAVMDAWGDMGDIAQSSAEFLKLMVDTLGVAPEQAALLQGLVEEMLAIAGVTDEVMMGFVEETYALIAAFGAAEEGSADQAQILGELAGRYKTAAGWMETFKKAGIEADAELVDLIAAFEVFNFAVDEGTDSFIDETTKLIAAYKLLDEGSEEQAAALTELTSRYQTTAQWTELLASVGKEADEELVGLIASLEELGIKLKDTTKAVDPFDVATYKLLTTYDEATDGSILQAEALSALSGRYSTATGWLEQFAAVGTVADTVLLDLIAALEAIGLTGEAATKGFVDETNALITAFGLADKGSAKQADILDDLASRYSTVTGWIEALSAVGIEASEALTLLVAALEEVGLKAVAAAEKTFVQTTYELIATYDAATEGSVAQAEALQSLAGRYQTAIGLEELLTSKGIEADDELVLLIKDLEKFAEAAEEAGVDLVNVTSKMVTGVGQLLKKFGGEGAQGAGSILTSLGASIGSVGLAVAAPNPMTIGNAILAVADTVGTAWMELVVNPAADAEEERIKTEEERLAAEQEFTDNLLHAADAAASALWGLVESAESVAEIQSGLAQLQVNVMSSLLAFLWPLAGILGYINELFVIQADVIEDEVEAREKMLSNLNVPIGFPINRIRFAAGTPGEPVTFNEDEIGGGADEIVAEILTWWEEALEPFRDQIMEMIQPIADFRDAMQQLAIDLIPAMLTILEPILDTFGWALGEISTWMQDVFKPDFEEFAEGFATFWEDRVDPFWKEDMFPQLTEWFDTLYGWLGDIIGFFGDEGWDFLTDEGGVWDKVVGFVDSVFDMFSEFGQWVDDNWETIENVLLKRIQDALDALGIDLDDFLRRVENWLLGGTWEQADEPSWITKFLTGLGEMRDAIVAVPEPLRDIAGVLEGFANWLGIDYESSGAMSVQPVAAGMGVAGGMGSAGKSAVTINVNLSQERLSQIMIRKMTSQNVNDHGVGFAPIRVG